MSLSTPSRLIKIQETPFKIFLKLEFFNPGKSIKYRVASFMLKKAIKKNPNKEKVISYSTGNFGIGLAKDCLKYSKILTCVVPDNISKEKLIELENLKTKIVFCDSQVHSLDKTGLVGLAKELFIKSEGSILIDQFSSDDNPLSHYINTAPELWGIMDGKIDYLFASMGTGGTITGCSKYLKEKNPKIKVIGVTPASGIYFEKYHGLGKRKDVWDSVIEGVGEEFMPSVLDFKLLDDVVEISDKETIDSIDELIEKRILVGCTSGMAIRAAKKYPCTSNSSVVVICPDSIERYVSSVFNEEYRSKNKLPPLNEKNNLDEILKEFK